MFYFIASILIAICGIVMILWPQVFYDLVESWKNNAPSEPSDFYLFHTRLGGIVFLIASVAYIVVYLMLHL